MVDKKVVNKKLSAKERHRINILEILANPENLVVSRTKLAEKLEITTTALYNAFTTDELSDLEAEALKLRRGRYGIKLGQVDKALFEKAIEEKDVKAIELIYKRFENWNPTAKIEVNAGDQIANTLEALSKRLPD